jgi:hypothetical protein
MSSAYVRTTIKTFLGTESSEDVVDLTAEFGELRELLSENSIQPDADWLGVQFIGSDETPIGLAATNDQGTYRETGAIFLHVVSAAKIGSGDAMLTRGEALRNIFRGSRIESILIESVTPMNFDNGGTLQFDGGYMSGSFIIAYQRDFSL